MSRRIERIRRISICRSEVHHMSREMIITTNRHSRAAIPVHVPEMERIALPRQRASHTGHAYSPARVTNPNPTNSTPTSNASVSRRPSRNIYPRRTRANHRPTYCPRAFCAARLSSRRTPDTPVTTTPFALPPPPPASQPASQHCALRAWLCRPRQEAFHHPRRLCLPFTVRLPRMTAVLAE